MDEDEEIPLILGRPFLATGRTLIDVQQGKLVLRVGEDEVTFDVFKPMKFKLQSIRPLGSMSKFKSMDLWEARPNSNPSDL